MSVASAQVVLSTIDRLGKSLRPVVVLSEVGRLGQRVIESVYPHRAGAAFAPQAADAAPAGTSLAVPASRSGGVLAFDQLHHLLRAVAGRNLVAASPASAQDLDPRAVGGIARGFIVARTSVCPGASDSACKQIKL